MNEAHPRRFNATSRERVLKERPLGAVRPRLDAGLALGQPSRNCGGRALNSRSKRKMARRPKCTGSFMPLSRSCA